MAVFCSVRIKYFQSQLFQKNVTENAIFTLKSQFLEVYQVYLKAAQ